MLNHKIIHISAKRWFQKQWGNTYHSVAIHIDNKYIGKTKFAYGYDEAYLQTAYDLLKSKKLIKENETYFDFSTDIRNNRTTKYAIACSDVSAKREL